MTVISGKEPHIISVHGVQLLKNKNINAKEKLEKLVKNALARSNIQRKFSVREFLYEDDNDQAQKLYRSLISSLVKGSPITKKILDGLLDIIGDVLVNAVDGSVAKRIKSKLRKHILNSYESGHKVILVAHSLGTVYALDVLNDLIKEPDYFNGDDIETWPVSGLVTMGSPLGLNIDLGVKLFEKIKLNKIEECEFEAFPWHNYFNRLDPVVTGSVFGKAAKISRSNGPVEIKYGPDVDELNWMLRGHPVTSGSAWLLAHTTYWKNPKIGDKIISMLWRAS
jgi:hypothetical protein